MNQTPFEFLKDAFPLVPDAEITKVLKRCNDDMERAAHELIQKSITTAAVTSSTLVMASPANVPSQGPQRNAFDALMSKGKSTSKPARSKAPKKQDRTTAVPSKRASSTTSTVPTKKPLIQSSSMIDLTTTGEHAKEKTAGKGKGKRALTIEIPHSDEDEKILVKKGKKGKSDPKKRGPAQQDSSSNAAEKDVQEQQTIPQWLLEKKPFTRRMGFDYYVTHNMPALLVNPQYRHLSRAARVGVLTKMLRSSPDDVKAVYRKLHVEETQRYERELQEWHAMVEDHLKTAAGGGGGGSS